MLIFIDQEKCVNVARIKNGELQYVEKLPVDNPIICAAISPCNSIILMASSKTFHVWKEDQTSQPLHWVASNTGELRDFSGMEGSEEIVIYSKCCITSDSTKGVLVWLYFRERDIQELLCLLVDLNSKTMTRMIPFMPPLTSRLGELYAGTSYCIIVDHSRCRLVVVKLGTGKYVSEYAISPELCFYPLIVAHSKNDLVAIIAKRPASVQFLKIVVPE